MATSLHFSDRPLDRLHHWPSRQNECGAAILIFITIILLATTTLLVAELSVNGRHQLRTIDTVHALGEARQALMGYALRQAIPGTLPCPDTTGDGAQNAAGLNCQQQLGLLPTRTLNLPELTDGTGAKLWYSVSLNYVSSAAAFKNSSAITTMALDNRPVAAVVIAPGAPIINQGRRSLVIADFLEGVNADANFDDYQNTISQTQNDQVLGLDVGHYWSTIEKRVLADASHLLRQYRVACNEYPWAADFGGPYTSVASQQNGALPLNNALPNDWGSACAAGSAPIPASFLVNHWRDQLYYAMCTSGAGNCLTVLGSADSPVAGILIAPGTALPAQTRPGSDPTDYFESENSSLPQDQYRQRTSINHSSTYNDATTGL
ncbi:MAG: hypothetical protein ACI82A_004247 [Candidatus Azotimanducaceae bacterium]|jgi:hypothetical protein